MKSLAVPWKDQVRALDNVVFCLSAYINIYMEIYTPIKLPNITSELGYELLERLIALVIYSYIHSSHPIVYKPISSYFCLSIQHCITNSWISSTTPNQPASLSVPWSKIQSPSQHLMFSDWSPTNHDRLNTAWISNHGNFISILWPSKVFIDSLSDWYGMARSRKDCSSLGPTYDYAIYIYTDLGKFHNLFTNLKCQATMPKSI